MNNSSHLPRSRRGAALTFGVLLALSACGSAADEASDADDSTATTAESAASSESSETTASADDADSTETTVASSVNVVEGCEEIADLFVTRGSANPDLADPEVSASCVGDDIVVTSNGIPDFTYIETSPGQPRAADYEWTIPAEPTVADDVTEIPYVGPVGMTLSGIPIYGPTEGTGGDVDSLPGIVSVCGSHNGPTGFHTHKIGTSSETDCFFTPEEVAEEPQLVGYAFDGFPIYTGADQYTSSWELTDESLFATDTWAAHSYVEGSGDLDECNGTTDADGNYAYYTTTGFPYIMGCFVGELEIGEAGGDQGEEDRPERPDDAGEGGEADEDRPPRPEDDAEAPAGGEEDAVARPEDEEGERPAPPEEGDDDRPAPPEGEEDDRPPRPEDEPAEDGA